MIKNCDMCGDAIDDEEDAILTITPLSISVSEKIFCSFDDETGEMIGEPYSWEEYMQKLINISGKNPELLGSEK